MSSNLGEFYEGWQKYADAFLVACEVADARLVNMQPSQGVFEDQ